MISVNLLVDWIQKCNEHYMLLFLADLIPNTYLDLSGETIKQARTRTALLRAGFSNV